MLNLNNIKIAIASSKLEHVKRGVETWAKETAQGLGERGFDVTLYKGSGNSHSDSVRTLPSIKGHTLFSQRLMKMIPGFFWRIGMGNGEQLEETTFAWNLIREARKERFDIIHTQDALVAHWLRLAVQWKFIPSQVILGHGTEEPFDFIRRFDYVQHLAPHHLKEASEKCGEHRGWFAIGNFVDTQKFKPFWDEGEVSLAMDRDHATEVQLNKERSALRRAYGIPEDAFVILSVAAVKATHKRIDYLIREVHRLLKLGHEHIFLAVAGSTTPETQDITKLGRDLLGERVLFLQDQPAEKMPEVHQLADVFVLCSLKEMMPIALLEALATATPAIVHKYPVEVWMIGDGGECIDMRNEGALAEAVTKYFRDDYRKDKALKAREHAVRHFSKEVILKEYVAMYEKILKMT